MYPKTNSGHRCEVKVMFMILCCEGDNSWCNCSSSNYTNSSFCLEHCLIHNTELFSSKFREKKKDGRDATYGTCDSVECYRTQLQSILGCLNANE